MHRAIAYGWACLVFALAACGTPIAKPEHSLKLVISSSIPEGQSSTPMAPAGGMDAPAKGSGHSLFMNEVRARLALALMQELLHVGTVRSVSINSNAPTDIVANINAERLDTSKANAHALSFKLTLSGRGAPFEKNYEVTSDEGEPLWEKSNTLPSKGRKTLVLRVLKQIIPDIAAYAAP